jgi:GntR family transcriptional repressor for pyruvate dehydrogenase complex
VATPETEGQEEHHALALVSGGVRASQVTEALKRYIVVNRLPPGTRLPPERHLAEALMAGRNAVREALHSLSVLGIVEKRHGSGIYVRAFDAGRLAEQLSYGLREDAEYWSHLLEARIATELMLVPLVARRITDDHLARLHELLDAMRQQIAREGNIGRTDVDFHLALAEMAGNPVLARLARAVIVEYFRHDSSLQLHRMLAVDPITIRNHEPLLAALAARDPEASVEAMRYHFRLNIPDAAALLREMGPLAPGGGMTSDE